jgi:hypothetical protein
MPGYIFSSSGCTVFLRAKELELWNLGYSEDAFQLLFDSFNVLRIPLGRLWQIPDKFQILI